MKKIIKFFKPNYLIRIDDDKRKKVYMFDVATKKIYFHRHNFYQLNIVILGLIGGILSGTSLARRGENGLYLNTLSQGLKALLIVASIIISFLLLWLVIQKKERLTLPEYRKKHKNSKEIKHKEDVEIALAHARSQVAMMMLSSIGLLVWSIIVFHRFFTNENLATYFFGSILFLLFTLTLPNVPRILFICNLDLEDIPYKNN